MKQNTWQVSVHVVFLLIRVVVIFSLHTTSRGSSCARFSRRPCVKWAFPFDYELSIPSNFFFSFILHLMQSMQFFFHFFEDSSNTAYFAKKGDGLYWRILLHHSLWAQRLRLHGDCRVFRRVPDPATVTRATVPQGCGLRWRRARGDALVCTPSTCLSLPSIRLVCLSVVVVRVRKNGETRCGEIRETCCGKWSGAKCWTGTDENFFGPREWANSWRMPGGD